MLHKEVLLKLLDNFVRVCNEHGLRYYLAGGSVLGAVRHKGFIPWDDDIDVYLPRRDYEAIQQLPDSVWGSEFRLASWHKVKNYRYDFIKLELRDTTIIERFHPDYVGGVFLDIIPLDVVSEDDRVRGVQLKKIQAITKEYVEAYIKDDCECTTIAELIKLKIIRWKNRRPHMLDEWDRLASAYPNSDKLIIDYHSPWIDRPMPIEYIGEGVEMEFEGKQYRVPSDWDAYLKHIYGDYMTLPPIGQQRGHSFPYADYSRKIDANEARPLLLRMHRERAFHFSMRREIAAIKNR